MLKYACTVSLPETISYADASAARRVLLREIGDTALDGETVTVVLVASNRLRLEILCEERITQPSLDFFHREAKKKLAEALPCVPVTVTPIALTELPPTPVVATKAKAVD